jgi:glycosyltransferase involved in cell wall biosynthesis
MTIAFPHLPGKGGPGSFQTRFEKALYAEGWNIVYAGDRVVPDVVMVVGGTRKLLWLWKMKRVNVPILYRLDGINWLHRKQGDWSRLIRGEIRNLLCKFIHAFLADYIVYQSAFVAEWWRAAGWKKHKHFSIISNGVDLDDFMIDVKYPEPQYLLCLEGHLDYSPYAIELMNRIAKALEGNLSLVAYGGFENNSNHKRLIKIIDYQGKVNREKLSQVYPGTIYLSLDINPACPNTVIEALASGAPVVGFETGALKELVTDQGGAIVDYGSDPWKLGFPDVNALLSGIEEVKGSYINYAQKARSLAEENHNIKLIVEKYISVIQQLIVNERK